MSLAGKSEPIEALAERYLEERSAAWALSTLENRRRGLGYLTDFLSAQGRSLSSDAVIDFVRHVRSRRNLKGAPWSQRSIEWALTAARSFLRWALVRGHILEELHGLIVIRRACGLPRAIPEPDVGKLIDQGPRGQCEKRDRALLELLYGTGLRASEALHLGMGDVDLAEAVLFVNRGKGGKDRIVPFGERVRQAIRAYLREERPVSAGPLFLSTQGGSLGYKALDAIVTRAARHAGIRRAVSPHRLRHSYATHLLRHGAPLAAIQALLGHASLGSTQVYLALETKDLARMVWKSHPRGKEGPGTIGISHGSNGGKGGLFARDEDPGGLRRQGVHRQHPDSGDGRRVASQRRPNSGAGPR